MLGDWLFADDLNDRIDDIVLDPTLPALDHNGHVHVYSGPERDVKRQIAGVLIDNHERAIIRAARFGAVLIDDTRVGKFLIEFKGVGSAIIAGKGTFEYFRAHPHVDDADRFSQAIAPWQHASVLFALAASGYVTTTVSGAPPDGVYCSLETPHLINSYHTGFPLKNIVRALFVPRKEPVEYFNLVPYPQIEAVYTPTNWKPATKMIVKSEHRMSLQEALHAVRPSTIRDALKLASREVLSNPIELYEYFLESRECYEVARELMIKSTTASPRKTSKTPIERQQLRERRLEEFGAMALALVQTELDLMPAASRPSIIVPPCCTVRRARP